MTTTWLNFNYSLSSKFKMYSLDIMRKERFYFKRLEPWWWSSCQRALLLLRRPEFQSCWRLHFFCNIVLKRMKISKKRPSLAHFSNKKLSTSTSHLWIKNLLYFFHCICKCVCERLNGLNRQEPNTLSIVTVNVTGGWMGNAIEVYFTPRSINVNNQLY